MLQLDPPDHGRLRGLVVRAFTARRIEDMRPRIQQIVDEIIDRVEPRGRMDLIADFAFRLPVTVICDMLGIPEEDREVFFTGSRAGGRLLDLAPLSKAEIEEQNSAIWPWPNISSELFELRRREPGNDLTTHLVQAEENGNKLTNEELTANIILLFGAGHETTVNLIGNGLLALYRNPDQLRLLKSDPSLMANAIEELLRYDSSVQVTGRTTLEDVDEIGGIPLEKGQISRLSARLGQSRPCGLPGPRSARHHPTRRAPAVVRRGNPLLRWRPTGPHRRRDCYCDAVAPLTQPAAR